MIRAVFFDVGETLVNEARWWAELAARAGIEAHVIWAAVGAVVDRGERHSRAWELLGVERPEGVGFEAADLYGDADPCLRRLRADGYLQRGAEQAALQIRSLDELPAAFAHV